VLKVLTWNIFMMPEWVGESPNNKGRAAAIAEVLLERDFDILCLQKVFDGAARAILEKALAGRFPHSYGPANNSGSICLNSGVLVLSRYRLTDYQAIEFQECGSIECFSRKGALLVSGTCGATPFRLVVTHLQGEDGTTFTTENQEIRDAQMAEIRDRLITPHLEPHVPFVICGDFGTPRFADACGDETLSYRKMLATLGVDEISEALITLDEQDNALAASVTGRKNEVDYIFVRKNGFELNVRRERWVFKRGGWDPTAQRTDLSYHYAVSAELTFGTS
jgi:endonuclease/exonuclease/phosphatase family metal-dependent hydrolase